MDNTHAQRQARYRERQKAKHDEELAQAKGRIAELERALKQAQASRDAERKEASRDVPPPTTPTPPSHDAELARLKTANKNLRAKVAYMDRWYKEELSRNGKMPLATFRAIAKCLHPDVTPSASEREEACKLFNVFSNADRRR
jgi:hypothetical protein